MKIVLPIIIVLASPPAVAGGIPINPNVTQSNIQETICVSGYTKTIRPPVSYTNALKKQRMTAMGLPFELMGDFQLDHKIPLSVGGHPSNQDNLILQDADDAHRKDAVEHCAQRAVCKGEISLAEAQQEMWKDWRNLIHLCH